MSSVRETESIKRKYFENICIDEMESKYFQSSMAMLLYLFRLLTLHMFCTSKRYYLVKVGDHHRNKGSDYQQSESEEPFMTMFAPDKNGCVNDLEVLINKERVTKGLKPLKCDKALRTVAKIHNENCLKRTNKQEQEDCGHSWYGKVACKFDIDDPSTHPCMWHKPMVK